jgi:hypothetical protein
VNHSLIPNLPEGWKTWAESNEIRLLGLGLLLLLNAYINVVLFRSSDMNRKEKQFWGVVVWVFPIIGFLMAFRTIHQYRTVAQALSVPNRR